MACIWSGQERTGQAGKGRRHAMVLQYSLLNLVASALLRLMLSSRRPVRASTHLVVSSDQ